MPLVVGREEGRQHKLDSVGVQDRHDGVQRSLGSNSDALDLIAKQVEEGLREECQEGLGRSLQTRHEGRHDLAGSHTGWSTSLGLAGHGSDRS